VRPHEKIPGHRLMRCPVFMQPKWALWVGICIGLICFLIPVHVLEITALREGKTVFIRTVHPGEKLSTMYIHSVEKSPVWEFFTIDENYQIVLNETIFSSCNTGLPYAAIGDEAFYCDGDHFRISNMTRVLPELCLWVHKRYRNTLEINDSTVLNLPSLAGNTLLRVMVRKITLLRFTYVKWRGFWITVNTNNRMRR